MTGFWDDPSIKPASSNYMKFEKVGDEVSGTVSKIGVRKFAEGTADERTAYEFSFVEDDVPTMTAGQVLLQRALYDLRPMAGEHLTVRLTGIRKQAGKTMKDWSVEVKRADGKVDSRDTVNT